MLANDFGGKHTPPGGINAQHDGAHALLGGSRANNPRQGVAANRARWLLSGQHHALGGDDRHPGLGDFHRQGQWTLTSQVSLKWHGLIDAVIITGTHHIHQVIVSLAARQQLIHQPSLPGQDRVVARHGTQVLGKAIDIVVNGTGRQFPVGFDGLGIAAPQIAEPLHGHFFFALRHVRANQRFHRRLELACAKHMHGDREFLQRLGEVVAISTVTFQPEAAHRMDNQLIGKAGQQVLILGEVVPHRDNRLSCSPECLQRGDNFLAAANANIHQVIQFHHQGVDAFVLGSQFNGIDNIPQQDLVIHGRGFAQQRLHRIHRALLVHNGAHGV